VTASIGLSKATVEKLRARSVETGESMMSIVERALAPVLGSEPPPARRASGRWGASRTVTQGPREVSVSRRCYDRLTAAAAARGTSRAAIVEAAVADVGGAP
jgi:hypothetical protein